MVFGLGGILSDYAVWQPEFGFAGAVGVLRFGLKGFVAVRVECADDAYCQCADGGDTDEQYGAYQEFGGQPEGFVRFFCHFDCAFGVSGNAV